MIRVGCAGQRAGHADNDGMAGAGVIVGQARVDDRLIGDVHPVEALHTKIKARLRRGSP